jgi:carbamoyl-phosphate synthase small subunit
MEKAVLVLEDGTYYIGRPLGTPSETSGEVVFNTCMTGYQEILTDPSYKGQIVTMTYPLIGNYGLNIKDSESSRIQAEGFIVKEACENFSGSGALFSLDDYLKKEGITGLSGVDTRALTKHIRIHGSMFGIISSLSGNVESLLQKLREDMKKNTCLVSLVSSQKIIHSPGNGKRVVVIDFGCKENILRNLKSFDLDIYTVPYDTNIKKIMDIDPDGILLSNGPGDPADLKVSIENIKVLAASKPIWGICLGHQLLGLALGGKTYKLKFGHHGGNHAVKNLKENKCRITSQNHNYALSPDLPDDMIVSEINVNDGTVEGFCHLKRNIRAVQYHPEACPGPADSDHFFSDFAASI